MPEICRFFGIIISLNYNDHAPPHFHVRYGEYRSLVEIETLRLIEGSLPPRALGMVIEWASVHRSELREVWSLAQQQEPHKRISPLE
jgi:hypothetical protein